MPSQAPNASTGLHPDLSADTVKTWAQTDLAITATAVYSPGDSIGTGTDGNYQDGVLHALNVAGREVNTATFSGSGQAGWKIDTTEYDDDGHVLRTLDAANRDRALRRSDAPALTVDLPADTAAAARMLDTTNLYALNPNDTSVETGTQLDLVDSFGPLHLTVVPDSLLPQGTTVAARAHSHTDYDTGNEQGHPLTPNGGTQSLHLPVTSWTEASSSPGSHHSPPSSSASTGLVLRSRHPTFIDEVVRPACQDLPVSTNGTRPRSASLR